MRFLRRAFQIVFDALNAFLADDGWAIASHIALSALIAFFPFLIVLTSLAGIFGSHDLADQAASLILRTWPAQVTNALITQIHDVLTQAHGNALTISLALSLFFASNGVESLRVGLNRAYGVTETRAWYWLRLESIGYTLIAAIVSLVLALLLVLGPLLIATARYYLPLIVEPNAHLIDFARYAISLVSLVIALFVLHAWLPAGHRTLRQIMPGIAFTVIASLVSAAAFGQYLARFANNYVTTYAGLASVVIALVFLYFIAAIFIYGGALNAAIIRRKRAGGALPGRAPPQAPAD